MSGSKHFDKIAWIVTALMLAVTILFMNGAALGLEVMAHTMGYENRLFDNTRVHTIDIVMNDWDEFIDNATSEEYYTAAMVIDGEAYKNVAIRGKGNTSLSTVSSMNSERYSFKIEFDHYDNSITYHGLDKLSLNNLIQDTTMMKDYLTYTMMNEFGAAAPLCSFVYITVNGEDWGLYLAVEGVEDSFLERNYGSDYGELYKPDSMSFGGGRGNGKDFDMGDFMNREESSGSSNGSDRSRESGSGMPQMPDMGGFDPSAMFGGDFDFSSMFGGEMPEGADMSSVPEDFDPSAMFGGGEGEKGGFSFGGMGGFGMGSSDVKLQYVDDNLSSYSNIWNNAKTDITVNDQNRLIESLKKLSNGEEIDSVVDIEAVIRYFVVHNYVCNGDSYTGSMIHNYYLYEENGQLAMLPWDYNLAFGTFQGGNGQSTVNTPIDAPVSGGSGEDRPMWSWILSDESYTSLYHQYYAEFLNTVDIQGIIDNAYNLIKSYVEKDPTAFFTYEEFETGVETMRQFCALRSESISMQLANGETTNNMSYVDASGLTLSDMGSMSGMGGGFGGGMPGRGSRDDSGEKSSREPSEPSSGSDVSLRPLSSAMPSGGGMGGMPEGFDPSQMMGGGQMPDMGEMPEGFDPSSMFGGGEMPDMGSMPEGFDPSQMMGGFSGSFPGQSSGENSTDAGDSGNTDSSQNSSRPSRDNMQMPDGNWNFSMNGGTGSAVSDGAAWIWILMSVLVLGAGLIIAKLYR
ncbi:MAG: CotH kinase family protein [Clostridia bacterium]|nr:CotH kinase family protein [Clostridia bacterium]